MEDGLLPVFSVDTEEEAEKLLIMACSRSRDKQFVANELASHQSLANLQAFSDKLKRCYEMMKEKTNGQVKQDR